MHFQIITIYATDSMSAKTRGTEGIAQLRSSGRFGRPNQLGYNDLGMTAPEAARKRKYGGRRRKNKGQSDYEADSNITAGLPKVLKVAINGNNEKFRIQY